MSKPGDEVTLIGSRADQRFRPATALEVIGPRHFGFDADYVPIRKKKLIRSRH